MRILRVALICLFGLVAAALGGCGESSQDIAAREAREQQATAKNAAENKAKAEAALYRKYFDDCAAKNGDKHWGPFKLYVDYRRPAWYKNNRHETIKPKVDSITDKVWEEAKKQKACVVAERHGPLTLDNGASFTLTTKIRQRGVPRKEWKERVRTVKEVYLPS